MKKRLVLSSAVFLIVICAWPVVATLTIKPGPVFKQLTVVADSMGFHVLNFSLAVLIGPTLMWMLVEFLKNLSRDGGSRVNRVAILLYGVYLALITVSYASQFTILPVLLRRDLPDSAMYWFFYNDRSIAYLLNQSAYLAWSVATILVFVRIPSRISGSAGWAVILLLVSALMQAVATIGFYAGIKYLAGLTSPAGLLLLPAGILILIHGIRYRDAR